MERVLSASRLMVHRGPDDQGYYRDANAPVALGHVRLSILDLSSLGHQPMLSADQAVVLVFNGEIYNFRELRADLQQTGYCFQSHSDTEVLLALYLRDGEQMLPRLNGIFAFALWDRPRQQLLLVRDPLGVKPLYFSEGKKGFAFASEIKALLPLMEENGGIDAASLHRYLSFLWCPGEGTPLQSVRKLGPGEALVVRRSRIVRRWVWYSLPAFHGQQSQLLEADAIHGAEAALRTAVYRQLVADVPVGAFLSGGLDSSAVVAMACEQAPNICCFTIELRNAEEGMEEDLPYARQVAKHLGVPLEVVSVDSSSMAADLESMVYQLDEPLADPAPLNVLYISRLARQQGVKVLLSGAGGDDLFSGYRRHIAMIFEGLWSWWPKSLRNRVKRATARVDQRRPLFRRLAKVFSGANLEGDERLVNYFLWAQEEQLLSLYTPEFREALDADLAEQPMLDFLVAMPRSIPQLDRLLALEQRFFLCDHNLIYTDKMSMAAGVEVRVPFLDLELVEFAAHIPPKLKLRGIESKWVLKKAMEPYLPREVIYRSKSGFGAPIRRWIRHEWRDLLSDVLSETSLRRRGLFDATSVQRLIQDNHRGRVDASYTLMSLLCIEIWCRQFLDQKQVFAV